MTEQNQELLLAISDMLDQKFEKELRPIKDDICEMKTDVKELQSDVTELKTDVKELQNDVTELQSDVRELRSDVTELQSDVKELRSDVTELQSDVKELRSDVTELQSDVTELQNDVTKLQENVHGIHLYLENEVDYKISLLAENYVPAAKRFEQSASRIDAVEEDVGILKTVVAQHSKMLQRLA